MTFQVFWILQCFCTTAVMLEFRTIFRRALKEACGGIGEKTFIYVNTVEIMAI
jgi:hypothetical protein